MTKERVNKVTEVIWKCFLTLLVSGVFVLLIGVRDFNKFEYPSNEEKRSMQIENIASMQNNDREAVQDKVSNIHKRVDGCIDMDKQIEKEITEIQRKLDLVLYKLSINYVATN